MPKNIGCLIQARLSSKRLPGKMLMPIQGKPLVSWVAEAAGRSNLCPDPIVITSSDSSDDRLYDYCVQNDIRCFRGPLDDVAGRFIEAARNFDLDAAVRISGDSPFIDPALIDRTVALFLSSESDLATNVRVRSYPKGQSVEVISADILSSCHEDMSKVQREHVTKYFYDNQDGIVISDFLCECPWEGIQMSVDTSEDLARAEIMARRAGNGCASLSYRDWAELYFDIEEGGNA